MRKIIATTIAAGLLAAGSVAMSSEAAEAKDGPIRSCNQWPYDTPNGDPLRGYIHRHGPAHDYHIWGADVRGGHHVYYFNAKKTQVLATSPKEWRSIKTVSKGADRRNMIWATGISRKRKVTYASLKWDVWDTRGKKDRYQKTITCMVRL